MVEELHRLSPFDPEHLPEEILLTEAFHRRFPDLPQVACFDTAFHHDLPRVARLLPIPRRYEAQGVRRYGFHGLSYAFLMGELARLAGTEAAQGRVILAHLGNGASLAAVRDGKPVDTSMSFTPTAGVPMSTRSGDLDPGLVWYLARTEKMSAKQFNEMVNFQSGLLGVSETSSDMRDLLDRETQDVRAAEAVALFCYQVKKWIGAFAAALGGLDTLVFAGGIGENAPTVRARICDGLGFLGIELEEKRNAANEGVISAAASRVAVRVIRTDEECMIARSVCCILGLGLTVEKDCQPCTELKKEKIRKGFNMTMTNLMLASGILPALQQFVSATKLHPILVNFTAALVPISVASDVAARFLKNESLRNTAWWTFFYTTAITPFTAITGWLFWMSDDNGVTGMTIHKWLGTGLALLLFGPVCLAAYAAPATPAGPRSPTLIVGGLFIVALSVQGYLGGAQVFSGM